LGKALQYGLSRWDALTRYIDDGRLSIDNNLAERLLRGIAVTRKNFLFLGSDSGGDRAAILYTVIETAKLTGLDPEVSHCLKLNVTEHRLLPHLKCYPRCPYGHDVSNTGGHYGEDDACHAHGVGRRDP
jgi:transposase IS66 family protein